MSVVPIIISGVFYPKNRKDPPQPGTFVGNAGIYGLEIGGGPVIPPDTPPPEQPGGTPPKQVFPIWGPPGMELPDSPGYPPVASHPLPEPQPPVKPPDTDFIPGWDFQAGWNQDQGWFVVIIPEDGTLVPTPSGKGRKK